MKKILLCLTALISFTAAHAQWDSNPASANNAVISGEPDESFTISISDGADGAIIISQSYNLLAFPFTTDINAQRINAAGVLQWGNATTPKSVLSNSSPVAFIYLADAIPDGSGGAYIAWQEYIDTFSNIYLQHINSSGNKLWPAAGIKVNRNNNRTAGSIRLCTDGGGGVVATWDESIYDEETETTLYSQIFAQRFNSNGDRQWGINAVQVCTNAGIRAFPSLVYDGSGYVIYFPDTRNSTLTAENDFENIDVFAQRLNTTGSLTWAAAGVPVVTTALNQIAAGENLDSRSLITDGAGGTIYCFAQSAVNREDTVKLFAQRLNASGVRQWNVAGISVCNIESSKSILKMVSDGAGGVVAAWQDFRTAMQPTLYAQRITSAGTASWTTDGINILPANESIHFSQQGMTEDGAGNYIFTWAKTAAADMNIVAQKLSNAGSFVWGNTPKPVCTRTGTNAAAPNIVKSNAGASIIAWLDQRNGFTLFTDVYAAKIGADGNLGGSTPVATTYTFTGNGNWNNAANWSNNSIPPATLPSGSTITINHAAGGQCVLNVSQTIAAGATLTVLTGKNLVVAGNLSIN
ncbi:MAG TPA: hypothetical protein PKC39_01240 [Ferruginibacter sp.]|nr:hypothetical protein [Ferruginibacter sp.]HMP19557.1 hypothetical protein [Ferruginibacter sp.]